MDELFQVQSAKLGRGMLLEDYELQLYQDRYRNFECCKLSFYFQICFINILILS